LPYSHAPMMEPACFRLAYGDTVAILIISASFA